MTADERIEKLLNRFGQTISDLPKAPTAGYAYGREHLGSASIEASDWHERFSSGNLDCEDYICHLCDVIDRMEVALETAARWGTCFNCAHHKDHDFPKCEKNNGSGPCWEVDDDYFQDVNDTDE